ncbi:hypothetical protein LOK49_LG10G02510 [Camellia lanceoleosa]|uniref:Uncharacterized protein n=1 Tax=Camellia lanceoleosa TaxID=1840588 RepID=A0ACC0G6C4_9ERIC|nr:hypothetical protein LOK49_LG10G02510 [Camellia lanceoleosa]
MIENNNNDPNLGPSSSTNPSMSQNNPKQKRVYQVWRGSNFSRLKKFEIVFHRRAAWVQNALISLITLKSLCCYIIDGCEEL